MGADVSGSKKAKSEPNVVPLCDILLVLLIIFMVITPLLKKGANVRLPEALNSKDQPESGKMVTVFIKSDGAIFIDEKALPDLTQLTVTLEDRIEYTKQEDKTKVLLKADKECPYGRVTEVMDEIRRANIEMIGLVADKSTAER
jgi:biopolymer transport protein TolR